MKHWRFVWTVAAVAALSAGIASQTPSGHAVFEQALAKERVDGNLQEAIRLYERVATEFTTDRALAAQALVQVGRCYEKLGRDEAVRAYERLVRDFADQEDAVEQARLRLAVLKRPAPGAAAATMPIVRAFPRVDNINDVQALSPDGTKAVFINYDKGQNLAVYDVASQQTTRLTDFDWTSASSWVSSAAWSPEGRRIAYMACSWRPDTGCDMRVATLAGESNLIVRREEGIAIWPVPAGWLPDGSALVVMLGRADNTYSIGLVPAAGGPFTQLRSIGSWAGQYPEPPKVSPDGRWIAFSEGSQGMRGIHVISRDGRTAHRLTDRPADDYRPLWSPDGRHVAFLSNRNGSVALWTVAVRDGQPVGEPVRIKEGMQDANLLGWTTRGLAYSEHLRTDDIYTVPVDPTSGEPVGSPRLIPYRRTGRNVAPGWSPDGKYLAFVASSAAEPDRRAVVLLPSGGGEPREFPIPPANYAYAQGPYDLRWFGDNSGLGFSGLDSKGAGVLLRLTLATGEWKTYPLPVKTWTRIDWNADGSRYFYARQAFGSDDPAIVERDLQSDRERIVFRRNPKNADSFRGLRFSPDRRSLAIKGTSGSLGIAVLDVETGQTRLVYDKAVGETQTSNSSAVPTWSPNGRALLVARTDNPGTDKQATDLRLIPVDGGEVRRIPLGAELTRLLSPGRGAQRPTVRDIVWSPDGGSLAFVLSASRLETWVIENPLALASAADAGSRK
jgi:Tol biopolymer transport system component